MADPMQQEVPDDVQPDTPSLVVQFGSTRRKDRPLSKVTTILGRSRACDITLDAPDVAPIHCLITRTSDAEVFVRDCQTRSGTLLNEQPIREALAKNNDTLQLGPFTFTFRIPEPTTKREPQQPAAEPPVNLTQAPTQASPSQNPELLELRHQLEQQLAEVGLRQTELDQGLQLLSESQESLKKERARFEEMRRAFHEELAKQREELDAWQTELEKRNAELATRPTQVDDQTRAQLEAEIRQKVRQEFESGELSVLNGEIDRLAKVLEESNNERDRLLQQLQESQQAAKAAENVAALQEQIEVLSQHCTAIAAERDALKAQFQSLGTEAAVDFAAPEILAENERLKTELAAATEKIQHYEERLQRVDAESDRRLASLRAELEDERRRTKELVKEAAADYERTRNEIAALKQQLEYAEGGGGAAAQLQAEVETLRATVSELQAQLQSRPSVPADLAEYEEQLNEFRASLEQAQQQLEMQESELKDRIKQAELQLSKDRANLARQQAELERLRTEFKVELEHAEREAQVQAKLAPVRRLKDEMRQNQQAQNQESHPSDGAGTPLAERIRNILKRMS